MTQNKPSAYDQGWAAFRAGSGLSENPYDQNGYTTLHARWEDGWFNAELYDSKYPAPVPQMEDE